ncbi:MAG: hypothetical protein ACREPB_16400 [Arenimonas sp.]
MALSNVLALAIALVQPNSDTAKDYVTVPLNTQTGLPTLQATVSGKPVTLILDLGGYKGIALTPAALAKLDVKYDTQVESWRNSEGEVFTAKLFAAPNVKIGEQSVGSVDGIEYATTVPGVDGYIGFAVLRNYTLVLDYPHNELRIYPPASATAEKECGLTNPISFDVVSGVVQSKVGTDDGDLIFQWDTGASENVLRPSAINLNPDTEISSHIFKQFSLGTKDFGRTRIPLREFVAPNVDGVLGTEFFVSKMVCLNFNKKIATIK